MQLSKKYLVSQSNMTYGGDGLYREAALMDGDDDIVRPAGLGGDGWWDDAVKETKRVAKRVQKS
eukprot:COSAG06_NODE_49954_length_322_cov_0.502242_1_plen_63_part_01